MFDVKLPEGKYVVAVSGGVDSMVLLDVLARQVKAAKQGSGSRGVPVQGSLLAEPKLELVVAHVNHGVRSDAFEDQKLVQDYAMSHNLEFIHTEVKLGAHASEALARQVRYDFLRQCRIMYKADAIITAQHQDDLVETVVINVLRGTGWRGLAPLTSVDYILRPLLGIRKSDIIAYAKQNKVPWREDSTNADQLYLRNYVRHSLVPRLQHRNDKFHETIMRLIRKQQSLRRTIEQELNTLVPNAAGKSSIVLSRHLIIMTPPFVAYEIMQQAFRVLTKNSVQRPLAESILVFAKAARSGKVMPLDSRWRVRVTKEELIVEPRIGVIS